MSVEVRFFPRHLTNILSNFHKFQFIRYGSTPIEYFPDKNII